MGAREGDSPSLVTAKPPGLLDDDHVRGEGPLLIVYADLACPRCASVWELVRRSRVRVCARHFPLSAKRPRAPVLHAAAEAVALQERESFWKLWDSLLDDRAHTDDPHLWERVERLGLDVGRFEADRRSDAVAERVKRDFRSGIRAGVTGTPGLFHDGRLLGEPVGAALEQLVARAAAAGSSASADDRGED